MAYLLKRREDLGGFLPARKPTEERLTVPEIDKFRRQLDGTGDNAASTTQAFSTLIMRLLKDKNIGQRIVPIIPDEARTFGMEGLFSSAGIYASKGQLYEPVDAGQLMYYKEAKDGQVLEEGINEAGAVSSFIAAGAAYSNLGINMIPFYIYYSMFGFQRIGDLIWLAADSRVKGFLVGGTSGRTTLNGEGLQHEDGHSHLIATTVPTLVSYDPAYAYELAVIIQDGLRRMYGEEDVYYYLTLMNENYAHPPMPKGVEADILKGMYLLQEGKKAAKKRVQLLGSGTILRESMAAAEILEKDYGVVADIWSVTSFNELRKEVESVARYNRLHPDKEEKVSHVKTCLQGCVGPVIATTDYMKLFADQIRQDIEAPYYVLGTDGFGRSGTRASLRDFFEVDAKMIAYTALKALCDAGEFDQAELKKAMKQLKIDPKRPDPIDC
ncbi:MAG: pyruvate dehydrogenase [Coxiellaceae bacterium]|nr:pyruvate dehydrogenase [Coxiellaceae bacterium]